METNESHFLFIPIARLLASYSGNSDHLKTIKGHVQDPISSADLNADVIVQTAFIQRSYEEEDQTTPSFILDDANPASFDSHDVHSFFQDLITLLPPVPPLNELATVSGLAPPASVKCANSTASYLSLLRDFDHCPMVTTANILLVDYMKHLTLIYEHLSSSNNAISEQNFSPSQLAIANDSLVWTIPARSNSFAHAENSLPLETPVLLKRHLQSVLLAAGVSSLSPETFTLSLSRWTSNACSPSDNLFTWTQELREVIIEVYSSARLGALAMKM